MRRIIGSLAIVGMLLALPACGGKTNERVRAAGIVPANAIGFLSVNLEPAIEQQRSLLSFAKAFPDAKVKDEFGDAKDELLSEILSESGMTLADVKPWLGKEIAVAAFAGKAAGSTPSFIVIIDSSDDAKAEAALKKAKDIGGYRVVDGYALVVGEQDTGTLVLDAVAAQAKDGKNGLAEQTRFTQVIDELHGDRLVLGWVDTPRLAELGEQALSGLGGMGGGFTTQFGQSNPIAFDLHAAPGAMVIEGAGIAAGDGGSRGAPKLTEGLPAETMVALSLFNIGGSLTKAFGQLDGSTGTTIVGGEMAADAISGVKDGFKEATGLDLEGDLLSWMGGEVVVAAAPSAAGHPFPDVALLVEPTDKAKAESAVAKIRQALVEQGLELKDVDAAGTKGFTTTEELTDGVQPAMALFEDRFVIATSPAYLTAMGKPSTASFGASQPYRSVVDTGDNAATAFQLVLRIDPIREAIEKATGLAEDAEYMKDVQPNLEPLDVLGIRAFRSGKFDRFEMKLTVS